MNTLKNILLLASYNSWMNVKVYDAAAKLSIEELKANRGAFFGSILGTLNHIVVGDTIWLKRFATHPSQHSALNPIRQLPMPLALDQALFTELSDLRYRRTLLDETIIQWAASLTDEDLEHHLPYASMAGLAAKKQFSSLVTHFFNHQTHHRGQASTLLSQAGQDVGVTDLLVLIPNEGDE